MGTKIFGITDSHQEARNLSALLSGILEQTTADENFILLDCGDLFKGVYTPDLSLRLYSEFKNLRPKANVFITLGNNDFGFDYKNFEYLKKSIKELQNAGIKFVCANLTNLSDGGYSNLVPQYEIIEISGKRLLITVFCLKTPVINRFGLDFEDYKTSFSNLINKISEDYDGIIVLNHHWYDYSKDLYEFAKSIEKEITLITGGHEHSHIPPDYKRNIFYPFAFARSLYSMELNDKIENIKELAVSDFKPAAQFESFISEYENEVQLFAPVAKRVLNLWKRYSQPCPLGTFLSDEMKNIANTDIAFHSTGMTMFHLKNDESGVITNYDLMRTISAETPIVKFEINTSQLKQTLQHSVLKRMYINNGNSRFLQCSRNIKITGEENYKEKTYKIVQIAINDENLLDDNGNPLDDERKFVCAADEFIANGGQGYDILKEIPKEKVLLNGEELRINDLLRLSLINIQDTFTPETEYLPFVLYDI